MVRVKFQTFYWLLMVEQQSERFPSDEADCGLERHLESEARTSKAVTPMEGGCIDSVYPFRS